MVKLIQAQLTVNRKEYITPHYVRLYFTGEKISLFGNTTVGVDNKILIPPKGVAEIHFPEFDCENEQWKLIPEEVRPVIRTFTHRGIDLERKEIWIDFVIHGTDGPASAWAIDAAKGDLLGVMMEDGKRELYPQAENYLLAGDSTGLPVLSAILEDLPKTAKGYCVMEVPTARDEQYLRTRADIHFRWLHNLRPQTESDLAKTFKTLPLPGSSRFAYVAAEFNTVKKISHFLRAEKDWQSDELYAYSFWKSGMAEEQSVDERQREKNEPKEDKELEMER